MRRAALVGALGVGMAGIVGGCAHVEPPPGGPEDTTAPSVVTVRPDSSAIIPGYADPVFFIFDERISERSVEDAVTVSPRTSPVEVRHGRQEIRVSLREGWEPGIIYHVRVNTDVRDLFNNAVPEPIQLVFSTGPTIPETELTGTIIDRITGEVEADVRVEAIRTDSLVYAVESDTVGAFTIDRFPEGDYLVRGFRDMNQNRALDLFEPRDSTAVAISAGAPVSVSLRLLPVDSTAPVPGPVTLQNGILEVEFDDYLDPEQDVLPGNVIVADSAGATLAVARVAIGELPELPADTAAPDSVPPAVAADPDDPAAPEVEPADPLPSQSLLVELAEGVEPTPESTYTVTITGVRNVNGLLGGGETELEIPAADPDP